MRSFTLLLALSLLAIGCAEAEPEDTAVDNLREFPDPPAGALTFYTPEYVIAAGSEQQWCWAMTYDGDDVGITSQYTYQPNMGHHVALFGTTATERDIPDGHVWDCTELSALGMDSQEPIIIGGSSTATDEGPEGFVVLPDGMAAQLRSGQRLVIQSHYVNYTEDDVRVADAAFIETIPEDEGPGVDRAVRGHRGGLQHPRRRRLVDPLVRLPGTRGLQPAVPGRPHARLGPVLQHRPDAARRETASGSTRSADWEVEMRDAPVYNEYALGERQLLAGDVITTTCEWFNHEGHALDFPQEMCVSFGMAYPLRLASICEAD